MSICYVVNNAARFIFSQCVTTLSDILSFLEILRFDVSDTERTNIVILVINNAHRKQLSVTQLFSQKSGVFLVKKTPYKGIPYWIFSTNNMSLYTYFPKCNQII